jgi:protein-tyrosine phosphatase
MAEALFRHRVVAAGLGDRIVIDSAGTGDWHIGKPPHQGTRDVLTRNGIAHDGLRARLLHPEDLENFDWVVAMDHSNVRDIARVGVGSARVRTMLSFVPDWDDREVPDPYFDGRFDDVYALLDRATDELLTCIRRENGW